MTRRRNPKQAPLRRHADEGAMLFRGRGSSDSPVTIEGEPLIIDVDSRALVDIARRVVLAETRENISEGRRPDGGPQRPLSRHRAAQPDRVSEHRGYATGLLADELRALPIQGDSARAEAQVAPPTTRNVFISTEAKRGVTYLGLSAAIEAKIMTAIGEGVAAMLEGRKVEAEQGEPLAKDES